MEPNTDCRVDRYPIQLIYADLAPMNADISDTQKEKVLLDRKKRSDFEKSRLLIALE